MDHPQTMPVSQLIGARVNDAAGEALGKVQEIMIDLDRGHVGYVAMSFGGMLGVGQKIIAVPWSALRIDAVHGVLVLDVDRQRLENAPGLDKDNWPDVDLDYLDMLHTHYDAQRYWQPR